MALPGLRDTYAQTLTIHELATQEAVERAAPILRATCPVWNFGDDPGAGNVVKLSGTGPHQHWRLDVL